MIVDGRFICFNDIYSVQIITIGQCRLLLETTRTTLFGRILTIGDVYGDESLRSIIDRRSIGLITYETNDCNLVVCFSRDIRVSTHDNMVYSSTISFQAYINYLSDTMKQSLLDHFRLQSIFLAMQWRHDIVNYFV
jgi:hypothetical protein